MPFKNQLAYYQKIRGLAAVRSTESGQTEKWLNNKSYDNPKGKRIRGTMFERKIAAPLSKMMIKGLE